MCVAFFADPILVAMLFPLDESVWMRMWIFFMMRASFRRLLMCRASVAPVLMAYSSASALLSAIVCWLLLFFLLFLLALVSCLGLSRLPLLACQVFALEVVALLAEWLALLPVEGLVVCCVVAGIVAGEELMMSNYQRLLYLSGSICLRMVLAVTILLPMPRMFSFVEVSLPNQMAG
eukprot:s1013_g16.t1